MHEHDARSDSDAMRLRLDRFADGYSLTRRETEVLSYLVRGRDTVYISEKLILSEYTVRTHTRHIYEKVGVHSKQELIDAFERDATA